MALLLPQFLFCTDGGLLQKPYFVPGNIKPGDQHGADQPRHPQPEGMDAKRQEKNRVLDNGVVDADRNMQSIEQCLLESIVFCLFDNNGAIDSGQKTYCQGKGGSSRQLHQPHNRFPNELDPFEEAAVFKHKGQKRDRQNDFEQPYKPIPSFPQTLLNTASEF